MFLLEKCLCFCSRNASVSAWRRLHFPHGDGCISRMETAVVHGETAVVHGETAVVHGVDVRVHVVDVRVHVVDVRVQHP